MAKKKRKYHRGVFTPKNKSKYVGDVYKIIYRSGWEKNYMNYLDNNPAILKWNSEDVKIKYLSPLDNKVHTYWVDFFIEYRHKDGSIQSAMIEIKPDKECHLPKRGKKRDKTFINEMTNYLRNQAKWDEAKRAAKRLGTQFVVITEKSMPSLLRKV